MKKIIVAKSIGFCFGVKRAIRMAEEVLEKEGILYSLGDIVHNPLVVERLVSKGLKVVEDIKSLENSPFIIRSHGLPPDLKRKVREKTPHIYDATCPHVGKVQDLIKNLSKEGYFIIIVGDKHHPEVKGLKNFAGKSRVIEKEKDFLFKRNLGKVAIVGQTTLSFEEYFETVKRILDRLIADEVKVFNTLCKITQERQKEAEYLSKRVDALLVLGGKRSSNTKKLYNIGRKKNKNTFHIERLEGLKKIGFEKFEKIGIISGTSTPQEFIGEVIEYFSKKGFRGGVINEKTGTGKISGRKTSQF